MNEETLSLVQLGIGTVGRELIKKVMDWNCSKGPGKNYSYAGFADKSGYVTERPGFSTDKLEELLERKGRGEKLIEIFPDKVEGIQSFESSISRFDEGVLIDVTDAGKFVDMYREALDSGWSVVLANKIPLTEIDPEEFCEFRNRRVRYETTVGAGLPVISTLNHLKRQGEDFKEIAAVLSGSLGFILSRVEKGFELNRAVLEAKEKGFTEPDPAEDLLGNDVARKAVILEIGRAHV